MKQTGFKGFTGKTFGISGIESDKAGSALSSSGYKSSGKRGSSIIGKGGKAKRANMAHHRSKY